MRLWKSDSQTCAQTGEGRNVRACVGSSFAALLLALGHAHSAEGVLGVCSDAWR